MSRAVWSGSAFYQVSVTGGGFEQLSQIGSGHHKIIGISLFGTTASSQLNITLKSAQAAFGSANTVLQIGKIDVHSGLLGAINAGGAANLLGNVTALAWRHPDDLLSTRLDRTRGQHHWGAWARSRPAAPTFEHNGLVNITGNHRPFSIGALFSTAAR